VHLVDALGFDADRQEPERRCVPSTTAVHRPRRSGEARLVGLVGVLEREHERRLGLHQVDERRCGGGGLHRLAPRDLRQDRVGEERQRLGARGGDGLGEGCGRVQRAVAAGRGGQRDAQRVRLADARFALQGDGGTRLPPEDGREDRGQGPRCHVAAALPAGATRSP
jgi:hypothetical protein